MWLVLLATSVASANERQVAHLRFERAVIPGAAGPNRLPVDVTLLAAARPLRYANGGAFLGGLEDLRLYDPAGLEVGYLLVGPPQAVEEWQNGAILPILSTEEESGFEIDLGSARRVDRLRLAGIPAPFLKRLRLEGGGDRSRWSVLVADGTLFDLPSEGLRRMDLDFTAGEFRYFRVTWDDRTSAALPLPRSASARVGSAPVSVPPVSVPITFTRDTGEPGESHFRLHLPGPHLPITAIELKCGDGPVLRRARLDELGPTESAAVTVLLGTATLRRTVQGDRTAADLHIPIRFPRAAELNLVVEDGDNPPLDLLGVSADLAPLPWIYFESAGGGSLVARFGDPELGPAVYDLEAMRQSLATMQFADAQWGEPRDVHPPVTEPAQEGSPLPAVGAPLDTTAFRYARTLPAGPPGLTALTLDAAVLAHSQHLQDLRLADRNGAQVPYVLDKRDQPLTIELDALQPLPPDGAKPTEQQTRYRLMLPFDSLPPGQLIFTTHARVFSRQVSVSVQRPPVDVRSAPRTEVVASGSWVHALPEKPAPPLTLPLPAVGVAALDVLVGEGDNTPLPLLRPKLLLPSYRIRFIRSGEQELTVLYGQPRLRTPRYDLQLLLPRMRGVTPSEVSLGPEILANTLPVKHGTELQSRIFWGALVAAVVILLGLITRLVTKDSPPG
jgi:hypothetical protein